MEITSGHLDHTQIRHEICEIAKLLRSHGVKDLLVEFGWGSKLEIHQLWKDIPVQSDRLETYIYESEVNGIYSPGNADLFIMDQNRSFTFMFCHEADIHLTSDNTELMEEVLNRWRQKGYHPLKRGADNRSVPS